jgi:hypothetical protein
VCVWALRGAGMFKKPYRTHIGQETGKSAKEKQIGCSAFNNNNNFIELFIIYVPSQQLEG